MSQKAIVLALAVLAFAPAAFAAGQDVRPAQEPKALSVPSDSDLQSLFETPPDVIVLPGGMMVAQAPAHLVMLVRIAADGSVVTACVDSAEAAARFLHPQSRPANAQKAQEK